MKLLKRFCKLIWFLSCALAVIVLVNRIFCYVEERKHRKAPVGGSFYRWKYGKVFYHKRGHGAPVILLHGFAPHQSGKELETLSRHLSTNHTVYRIDLPGFGLSDKPWITYTNFLYVLLLQHFIDDVICDVTDIIACGGSCLCALQAQREDDELIGKIVLVNPCYEEEFHLSKSKALWVKKVLDLPIIGTFFYNLYSLKGAAPFDKEGRHVFASRLAGYLTSDISDHPQLSDGDVAVFESKEDIASFTFGDVKTSLL